MQIHWTEQARAGRGLGMVIAYDTEDIKPYGQVLVARTEKGICFLGLPVDRSFEQAIQAMRHYFPMAEFVQTQDHAHVNALDIYGTPLQISVWQALLKIPEGETSSYKDIAKTIGHPTAFRAIGNAVGANPVAIYIPCHRVIASNGGMGGYAWGMEWKKNLLDMETQKRLKTEIFAA